MAGQDFLELYRPVAPAIYAWAHLHIHAPLKRRLDPEDVLQEVCFRAIAKFSSYQPELSPFRAWMFGIAHNVLREALRSLRTRGESVFRGADQASHAGFPDLVDQATGVSTRMAREENLQAFLAGLDDLTDEERRLLLYRGLEGKRHQEVAEVLQISQANAEKRWQRLCAKLQKRGLPDGLVAALS